MTRNTKLYKLNYNSGKEEVYYRDITALEYSFLSGIKNDGYRYEIAAKTAIIDKDIKDIPIGTLIKIGQDVINKVNDLLYSKQLFEITIQETRKNIESDDFLLLIKGILAVLPGQSYTDLLNLNYKDLIELACLCEKLINKPIFNIGRKGLVNTQDLSDNGKSIQDKINNLSSQIGPIPK